MLVVLPNKMFIRSSSGSLANSGLFSIGGFQPTGAGATLVGNPKHTRSPFIAVTRPRVSDISSELR